MQQPQTPSPSTQIDIKVSSPTQPVELDAALLSLVSGAGPNGGWNTPLCGPNGGWF